jgi:site-specific recombinase XerC
VSVTIILLLGSLMSNTKIRVTHTIENCATGLEPVFAAESRGDIFNDSHTVDLYLASLDSEASRKTMKRACSLISKMLGAPSYREIVFENLENHGVKNLRNRLVDRKPAYSPSTINLYLSALRGILKTSLKNERIDPGKYASLLVNIDKVSGSRSSKGKALSELDVSRLMLGVKDVDIKSIRDHAIFCVMVGCGLRRDEVSNMMLKDYQRDFCNFHIIGKGNKEREVPLNQVVASALNRWIDEIRGDDPGPLFLRLRKRVRCCKIKYKVTGYIIFYANMQRS